MSEIKRKIGRPPKDELSSNLKRNVVGRPKGDRKVLDAIFDAALDNEHKNQAAAWKLVVDRILPVSAFEQDVLKQAGRSAIQINITGLGVNVETPQVIDQVEDAIEVDEDE